MRALPALAAAFVLVVGSAFGATVTSASAVPADTDSKLTKRGQGEFAGLEVTVSQTRNLVDQVVEVDWRGGTPTTPGSGQYAVDYMQIMQCWGDDPSGPSREQCQFGANFGDVRGGAAAPTRQLNYAGIVDPLESIRPPAGSTANVYAPFRSVTGKVETGALSEFFDGNTTNEVAFGLTRPNGSGEDYFTVQSIRDAPGLGCGEPITTSGRTKGRSCWLVVVPRGNREVDGSLRSASGTNRLQSSPLSQTNWNKRITFPLEFEPVGRPCPLGSAERKTLGHDNVAEALTRWQPALCAEGGPVFSYSQVSDDVARRELTSTDPGLAFLSEPLAASALTQGSTALYAPVALSGVTIGLNVQSASVTRAPPEIKARDGERIPQMRLTPRLVAKLLTQSYTRAAFVEAPSVAGNPTDLTQDPEFSALNPNFDGLRLSLAEVLLPLGRSDVTDLVWRWVISDVDAKAFLDGKVDPWGTKVNTTFKNLSLPRPDFPKNETFCREFIDDRPPLCNLDLHPYVASMGEGAKAAARGDTLAKVVWDPNAEPPAWKKDRPQASGSRAMLAITDTASAVRYGLDAAELLNAGGAFVGPSTTSLRAATARMKPWPNTTVLRADPTTKDRAAYPLANLSYAATVPQVLDATAKQEYAAFLTYAAGPGQAPGVEPGKLPFGYAPLPDNLAAQTLAVATALKTPQTSDDEELAGPGSTPDDASTDGSESVDPVVADVPVGSVDGAPVAGEPAAGGAENAQLVALTTPTEGAGMGRLVPFAALLLGLAAAAAGPLLLKYSTLV